MGYHNYDAKTKENMMKKDRHSKIIEQYVKLCQDSGGRVTFQMLRDIGVTKDMVAHHFGSLSKLDLAARAKMPDQFSDVKIESLYSRKALEDLRNIVASKKRLIITTAVAGAPIHEDFYRSIKTYCTDKDAKLLVLIASDPASNSLSLTDWGTISSALSGETIVMEDIAINSNIFISTIKMSAKQIDPTTGLGRVSQRNGSCIFASPKQRFRTVPVGNSSYPRILCGTGAITVPHYDSNRYMSLRTAYLADTDHVMGALIVEIEDDKIFHCRQVQADAKGKFIDLGVQYSPKSIKKVQTEAIVLGDLHSGSTDEKAMLAWLEAIQLLQPKRIVLHDAFDGLSINHHEEDKHILRARRAEAGQIYLQQELMNLAYDLSELAQMTDELVIVKSNHDLFLERYLEEGKYINDPFNHRIALELAIQLLDGNDPLKHGVEMHWPTGDEAALMKKINWLKLDQDYKVAGIQLACHGHIGSNGSKGTPEVLEASYNAAIVGHSHSPCILRGLYQVGTSSRYDLSYRKGASSWLHSSVILYSDGSRQLINEFDGKWKL
jgi:hypothetical protein